MTQQTKIQEVELPYDMFADVAPAMQKTGKGTEIVKLLLSKASKDIRGTLVTAISKALSTYITNVNFHNSSTLKKIILRSMCSRTTIIQKNDSLLKYIKYS